jgi:TolA-binding protein
MAKATATKPKGHLTKKELKQDKLVQFAYKAEQFYLNNQKWVLGVAFGILAVVVVGVLIHRSVKSGRMQQSYQLTMAKMSYGMGQLDDAKNEFEQLVSAFGSSAAGGEARYFLGRIAFEQGNYSQAIDEFTRCRKEYSLDDKLECATLAGLAASYESIGKKEDAAKTYGEVADSYPQNAYSAQALMEASRIYLDLNQNDKAIEVLKRLREEYPESVWASQAKRQLDALE